MLKLVEIIKYIFKYYIIDSHILFWAFFIYFYISKSLLLIK